VIGWRSGVVVRNTDCGPVAVKGWISPCGRFGISPPAGIMWAGRIDRYVFTHLGSGFACAACADPEILLGLPDLLLHPEWSGPAATDSTVREWRFLFPLFEEEPALFILQPGPEW
jgi:hypothetical protein